jgi:hypothetical protein
MSDTSQILADGQKNIYIDINQDGNSEEFIYYHLSDSRQPNVNLYSDKGIFLKSWALEGEIVEDFDFIYGNFNNDSLNEVYVFSKTRDFLFLYCLTPFSPNGIDSQKILVCTLNENDGSTHLVIHSGGLADMNGDGYKEMVFSVNSRFSGKPRKVFYFDQHNNRMHESPEIDMQLVGSPVLFDLNNDGLPEIFLSTLNSTNQGFTTPRNQALNSASMVLNPDLSFYTKPLLYESRMSISAAFPWKTASENYIVSLSWSLKESEPGLIRLQKSSGEIILQRKIAENNFIFDPARADWSKMLAFHRDGWILQYNPKGELIHRIDLKGIINQIEFRDIDKDGTEEAIIIQNNRLCILRNDFSHPVTIDIPGLSIQKTHFSIKERRESTNLLSLQNEHQQFLISYSENPFYWLRFILYLISVSLFVGGFWIVRSIHYNQIERIKHSNEKFYKMQLDLIRNQLDPHFLFNALNSIAFSINTEDRKTAYSNLGLFSKFLREAVVSLDEFSRSLDEEIDYVKNYLVLEKFRFKEKFNYDIVISPGINKTIKVPKLILFSFAESALKKGVLVKSNPGSIQIMADVDEKQNIFLQITDDGMYRNLEKSKEFFTKNMIMMEQIVAYFNSFNHQKITIHYYDKGTSDIPAGSMVKIHIPSDYDYLI